MIDFHNKHKPTVSVLTAEDEHLTKISFKITVPAGGFGPSSPQQWCLENGKEDALVAKTVTAYVYNLSVSDFEHIEHPKHNIRLVAADVPYGLKMGTWDQEVKSTSFETCVVDQDSIQFTHFFLVAGPVN